MVRVEKRGLGLNKFAIEDQLFGDKLILKFVYELNLLCYLKSYVFFNFYRQLEILSDIYIYKIFKHLFYC